MAKPRLEAIAKELNTTSGTTGILNSWRAHRDDVLALSLWGLGTNVNHADIPAYHKRVEKLVQEAGWGDVIKLQNLNYREDWYSSLVIDFSQPGSIEATVGRIKENQNSFTSLIKEIALISSPENIASLMFKDWNKIPQPEGEPKKTSVERAHSDPEWSQIYALVKMSEGYPTLKEFLPALIQVESDETDPVKKKTITDSIDRMRDRGALVREDIDILRASPKQFASSDLRPAPIEKRDPLAPGEGASRSA